MISRSVPACNPWFDTGVDVTKGIPLRVDVPPNQTWSDWYVKSPPEGRTTLGQAVFRYWLRIKERDGQHAEFLTLIGSVLPNQQRTDEYAFIVGAGPWNQLAPATGRLIFFANDVLWAYGNNSGQIDVQITIG